MPATDVAGAARPDIGARPVRERPAEILAVFPLRRLRAVLGVRNLSRDLGPDHDRAWDQDRLVLRTPVVPIDPVELARVLKVVELIGKAGTRRGGILLELLGLDLDPIRQVAVIVIPLETR